MTTGVVRLESTTGPFFWYKQAQLVLYDNRLYDMGRPTSGNRETLEYALSITPMPLARLTCLTTTTNRLSFLPKKYMLVIFYDLGFDHPPSPPAILDQSRFTSDHPNFELGVFFDRLTAPIKKIQRVMKRHARTRINAKRLAFIMGAHDRLGQLSHVLLLSSDLLQAVLCA
jgi:hypothetical protein